MIDGNKPLATVNDFICVKLGNAVCADGTEVDGKKTMQIYENYLWGHEFVWFSTDSLYAGMAKKQVDHYNGIIEGKECDLRILFAYNDGYNNDIQYSAKVLQIVSSPEPISAPDLMLPEHYYGSHKKIWIKISELQKEDIISAKSFVIRATGRNLQEVMNKSQFHFGYVSYL